MRSSTVHLHTKFAIAPVDPRIFGGFLEHMGRAVYEGVYDPRSVHADAEGFRVDVLDALRRLRFTLMRYPGGNFVSGYHWEDGIGPRDRRPLRVEKAWDSREPNHIGTDEFLSLCRQMAWQPMLSVNLGSGSAEEARNWVEYCNGAIGTTYGGRRAANGHPEPYGVKLWCLGNEMDGPWQIGHCSAEEYATRAREAARAMRTADPAIETIACGSSATNMPTFADWDHRVIEHLDDQADYISLHRYVGNYSGDTRDYLAISNSVDRQIEDIAAIARAVQAKRKSDKRIYLSFDEWNVWYKTMSPDNSARGEFPAHLIEEVYNLEDALVVAGFLNSFVRHADCVKIANLAQIVNVIAPLITRGDDLLIQSIFYPIEMFATRRSGVALRVVVDGPTYASNWGETTEVDCSAIHDGGRLHVFVTNRHPDEPAAVQVAVADRRIIRLVDAEVVGGTNPKAANSFEHPNVVRSEPFAHARIDASGAHVIIPPLSFMAATFALD
ncbi:MAG TPA: alpha-L-arabinofuranosidase C-terminal domain-containing protein [Candidatus Binatia bacterium]|nr:alpha-L-arabinofuranosidase C-terminal domain-containing protein [Candidatus Binatia bacterium]